MTHRALTIALDEWADQGVEPPKGNVARVQNKPLFSLVECRAAFPAIAGVEALTVLTELEVLNFGPEFGPVGGVQTLLPPVFGSHYTVPVPKPDKDGVNIAGIRSLQVRAPLGTNTGWDLPGPCFRASSLCGLNGSFIPLATTKAECLATGDPQKSLEEGYGDHAGFLKAIEKTAKQLAQERFLLEEDPERYVQAAEDSDVLRGPGWSKTPRRR